MLFTIYSKDGQTVRHTGKLKYNGTYMQVSYVEFAEIASPVPIAWEVGDYVEYSRTGLTYRLYAIPQPKKQARRGTAGDAFIYENVQFHADTKMLERAIFHDIVKADNGIHFSTRESLSTYENVYGIVTRIQACMDELYPSVWDIHVIDGVTADDAPELYTLLNESKEFTISGSCLDALSSIYNTWEGIGWVHTYDPDSGKNIVTVGRPNIRYSGNTTDPFLYGKGNGLTAIKKSYTNADDIATRLYVYGSDRNLISRYYNRKGILNADSVDIANLMIPIDRWGQTADSSGNLKPDARKAYIEKDSQTKRYGLIPKRIYFDGKDNDEVYPTVENFTVGELRKAKEQLSDKSYIPDAVIYPDSSERLDEVKSADNPEDDGITTSDSGMEYDELVNTAVSAAEGQFTLSANGELDGFIDTGDAAFSTTGIIRIEPTSNISLFFKTVPSKLNIELITELYETGLEGIKTDSSSKFISDMEVERISADDGYNYKVSFSLSSMTLKAAFGQTVTGVKMSLSVGVSHTKTSKTEAVRYELTSGTFTVSRKKALPSTFKIRIKQIGFDLSKQQATGNGIATVSMKTGMCGGRDFTVTACRYVEDSDTWELTLKRVLDDSLNIYFPNADYGIASGDRFVILDIMMPELYINIASDRLLSLGEELYEKSSRGLDYYEPEIDAKVMVSSGRILMEGMYMTISDTDISEEGNEYVLIDTLAIDETSGPIPEYNVTLREKKGVSFKEAVTNSVNGLSSKVVLLGGLSRQTNVLASGANDTAETADDYSRRSYSQAKETMDMLSGALDDFTDGITPVSVQTMALLVGSNNLQFVFVKGFDDITSATEYPVSFDDAQKKLVCRESYLRHMTLGITDLTSADARSAEDYYIWKVGGYESSSLDGDFSKYAYYVYAKVKAYDKDSATEDDRTGSFELSRTPHQMNETDGFLYLLVGILSSEADGSRNFARLHGFSEVLPGQIITDKIRSASGGSYLDLQTGNMALGSKLRYLNGVLYLDFLFSENANIGGWIFRNGRLESQSLDKYGNPMVFLDGKNGEVRLKGTMQFATAYSGSITDSNIFYLPPIDKGTSKSLDMGGTKNDIGKVVRFFNSSSSGGGRYYITCTEFTIESGITVIGSSYKAIVDPQEIVEMTCFECTGSTPDKILGRWEISGRFGYDSLKTQNASGRFPRILAMGRLNGGDGTTETTVTGYWYDGTSLSSVFSVKRTQGGTYKLTLKSGYSLPAGYKVFATGYNEDDYKAVWYAHDSGFWLYMSDDYTRNDGSADFMIFDPNWWYRLSN